MRMVASNFEVLQKKYWSDMNEPGKGVFFKRDEHERLLQKLSAHNACSNRDNDTAAAAAAVPKIGLCLIQHSAAPFVQEWLAYHLSMGFDFALILDNSHPRSPESARLREAAQPFVAAGLAEIKNWYFSQWNDSFQQLGGYDHCADAMKKRQFDWVAFFDVDEFLVVHPPLSPCVKDLMLSFAEKYSNSAGALAVKWRLMSSYPVATHNFSQISFEQYTHFVPQFENQGKIIANPHAILNFETPHKSIFRTDQIVALDFEGFPVNTPQGSNEHIDYSHVELRHFYCRSLEHCVFDKICGKTMQRKKWAQRRSELLGRMFPPDNASEAPIPLRDVTRLNEILH